MGKSPFGSLAILIALVPALVAIALLWTFFVDPFVLPTMANQESGAWSSGALALWDVFGEVLFIAVALGLIGIAYGATAR